MQVAGEAWAGVGDVPFHVHLFGGDVGQRVLFAGVEADFARHLGGQGGKFVHTVGIHIDGFQVAHGEACLFAARILGYDLFVGFYRTVVFIELIVEQPDFCGCLAAYRTFGVFLQQFPECVYGLPAVSGLHVRASFLVEGIHGVGRSRVFVGQPVEQGYLSAVVFLEAGHECQLIERIISGRGSHVFGLGVVLLGFIETAYMQVAVADAVAGVGQCGGVPVLFQLDEFQETALGKGVVFLMEGDVCQVVVSERVSFGAAIGGEV